MADMSDYYRTPMGCVVVLGNRVIGYGCNSNKTHPMQMKYNQYRNFGESGSGVIHKSHAEIAALSPIRHLDIDWSKVGVYVYRKRRDREFGLARPCPACMEIIRNFGVRDIFYTGDGSYIYEKLN